MSDQNTIKENYYDKSAREMGIRFVKDPRLKARLKNHNGFCDYIESCKHINIQSEIALQTITNHVVIINNQIQKTAIPFGCGGDPDKDWYSELASNWNTLYSGFMLPMIYTTQNILQKIENYMPDPQENKIISQAKKTRQMEAIQKLYFAFTTVYLDCALDVASKSWYREDVTPQWLGAIQTTSPINFTPPSTQNADNNLGNQKPKKTQKWQSPIFDDDETQKA